MPDAHPPPVWPDFLCDANGVLIELPPPTPVPDEATFLAERERALAFSPERRANYAKYLASDRRDLQPDYLPVRMDIENVSRCNFRCQMCVVSDWHKGTRARDLGLDEFKALIDQQYGLVEIKIQGLGEPTLQGDDFFRMIEYARAHAIWVRVVTNGSLLHLRDNYRKLIDSGVNEVQISIDGATAEVFEAIRRGSRFEMVRRNAKLINDYCTSLGIERTKMWTVVQDRNRHQIADLIRLGAEIGFHSMVFSLSLVDFGLEDWRERNDRISVGEVVTNQECLEYMALGDALGVKARFWRQLEKYGTQSKADLCPWPFERGFVSSDMRVVPCCIIANPDAAELGSAKDFTATWQSETWRDFRAAHLRGDIPAICKGCYFQAAHAPKSGKVQK